MYSQIKAIIKKTISDIGYLDYRGYRLPVRLINMTGGGADTWEPIALHHMREYAEYCPIAADAHVVEIGCGVGRDAIQLTQHLSAEGAYIGVDIIEPSIAWCRENIATRYPHFAFHHLPVRSPLHNAGGTMEPSQVRLPIAANWADRIILQSVFTHMFRDDIIHYLREFTRILRPGGVVFASVFVIDPDSLAMAKESKSDLLFKHPHGSGCFINNLAYPEGAVGYTETALAEMIAAGGMKLIQPIHRGWWCGREATDGQDVLILQVAEPAAQLRPRPMPA
jgi:SAM-dependent methyltransferase